ncbi:MAG: fused MFS/spermidine synthase [Propionibacteriaceae bacterium]|jgi:spermidine synthase|nr:fused MFS/spermidine synthase [Propionibacteriaceae bacterium]
MRKDPGSRPHRRGGEAVVESPDPRLVRDTEYPHCWLVRIDGVDHSFIDPDDPTHLVFEYVERIAGVIDTMAPPGERLTTIHVGGAGMTLARYIAHTRPTSAQIVLEPDAALTAAVRAVAPLDKHSGVKVRPHDGVTGLAALHDDYADLIIVDAFAGAQVPACFATASWRSETNRVLKPDGCLVMNSTDMAPFDYTRRLVAGFLEDRHPCFLIAEPSTLKGHRFGNLIIAAGPTIDEHALTRRAARALYPSKVVSGAELTRWIGGAVPFTDEDAEPSPLPWLWPGRGGSFAIQG